MRERYSKFLIFILLLCITGCSNTSQMEQKNIENGNNAELKQNIQKETEPVVEICYDLFRKADDEGSMDDLEVFRSIVNRLGDNGYAAIDAKNQIDMTEADQVVRFCEKVGAKEEGDLTIIKINDLEGALDGIVKYDLRTKDGEVIVETNYYKYENKDMQNVFTASYLADHWEYTKDGHLLFSGSYYSEELYALTLSDAEDYIAFRVQPLDEKCRELNRQYILPVSYERNNMFLVDWNEADFGDLDFYDLYDIFYPKINNQHIPYGMDDNLGVGAVYRIPKEEFESVIKTYFNIESDALKSKTVFYSEDETYEYKPRGFFEAEYPEYPFPEVVRYTENEDGTITLTVQAVFPYKSLSKVYAHEVVIRPLDNGGVQYVSNRIIPSEDNYEATWHKPRLTEEQWEEMYGEPE